MKHDFPAGVLGEGVEFRVPHASNLRWVHFGIVQNATVQLRLCQVYGNEALFVRAWFKRLGSPELNSAGTFPPELKMAFPTA